MASRRQQLRLLWRQNFVPMGHTDLAPRGQQNWGKLSLNVSEEQLLSLSLSGEVVSMTLSHLPPGCPWSLWCRDPPQAQGSTPCWESSASRLEISCPDFRVRVLDARRGKEQEAGSRQPTALSGRPWRACRAGCCGCASPMTALEERGPGDGVCPGAGLRSRGQQWMGSVPDLGGRCHGGGSGKLRGPGGRTRRRCGRGTDDLGGTIPHTSCRRSSPLPFGATCPNPWP